MSSKLSKLPSIHASGLDQFELSGLSFFIQTDQRRRKIKIQTSRSGFHLSMPTWVNLWQLKHFIAHSWPWIQQQASLLSEKKYFYHLGKPKEVIIIHRPKLTQPNIELVQEQCLIKTPSSEIIQAELALNRWKKKLAQEELSKIFKRLLPVANQFNLYPSTQFKTKSMKTRWGSCSSEGHITLSNSLVHMPITVIQFVILHEFCHLKHFHHNQPFFDLLSQIEPNWSIRRTALNFFQSEQLKDSFLNTNL